MANDKKPVTAELIWKRYDKGLSFNTSLNLNDTIEANENFFIGKQWEGVESNGLPTPVFNMLKQIVLYQVASISSDNITVNVSPLQAAANDKELEKVTGILNDEFTALFERNQITTLLREYLRNAAVDGDGCIYAYWDADDDAVKTEVIESSRVFFGNPNDRRVQKQPYIVIARRDLVDSVRDYAEEHGANDEVIQFIRPDTDENNSKMDLLVDGKCTVLLHLRRNKKTGTIYATESVKDVIIRKEWDLGIRLYPITWLCWDFVRDCYHGQALITGLIPNQQFVNKAYAMSMLSLMMSAFPKIVYDKNRVLRWTNQVGAQIAVNGAVDNIAKVLEPAQISPQVSQFIESAIQNTQNFTGATSAALGITRPDNTSAIIALQRASSIPSEITKQNYYTSVEDLSRICLEFMAEYYGRRLVDVSVEDVMDPKLLAFAQIPATQQMQVEFDFSLVKKLPVLLKMDIGASAYWSEIACMQYLENWLDKGHITLVDMLERLPAGYIPKAQELLEKYKSKEIAANAMAPVPQVGTQIPTDPAAQAQQAFKTHQTGQPGQPMQPLDSIPVEGGKGFGNLQRKVMQAGATGE